MKMNFQKCCQIIGLGLIIMNVIKLRRSIVKRQVFHLTILLVGVVKIISFRKTDVRCMKLSKEQLINDLLELIENNQVTFGYNPKDDEDWYVSIKDLKSVLLQHDRSLFQKDLKP